MRSGAGKAIVKDVARTVLPAAIVDRRKSGFGVPLAGGSAPPTGWASASRRCPRAPAPDVFDRAVLRRLVAEHRAGAQDHSELLWTALNLCTWRETFRC